MRPPARVAPLAAAALALALACTMLPASAALASRRLLGNSKFPIYKSTSTFPTYPVHAPKASCPTNAPVGASVIGARSGMAVQRCHCSLGSRASRPAAVCASQRVIPLQRT